MRGDVLETPETESGKLSGWRADAAIRVAKYLGEVGQTGAEEIAYYCEVSLEEFARIKHMLGLARRWTVEGGKTKPLYSLAEGSLWREVFGEGG